MPVQSTKDHAENCGARKWYRSEKYVDMYVKIPAVRVTISFQKPIQFLLHGAFVLPKPGSELFLGMADVLFKFASQSEISLKTTGFTRVRLPVIVRENNGTFTERIVFMTSHDRTVVAANSSRAVNQSNVLNGFEHNTPLVLFLPNGCAELSVDVSSGGQTFKYNIDVAPDGKFNIPNDLEIKWNQFQPKPFDAEFPTKKSNRY